MSRTPDFLIIGAPKCGTTALTRYLEAHPQVFMAARKDIHFFGSDLDFRGRPRDTPGQYLARFDAATGGQMVGESSVWYLSSTRAADEIAKFNPDMKVIALLRNPVETMYALWAQLRLNGLGDEDIDDFEQALAAEPARARGDRLPPNTPLPSALLYRQAVRFSEQVQRYIDALGRDQVHVMLQDDMRADTAGAYRGALEFLGIDPDFLPDLTPVNTSKRVRSQALRRAIALAPAGLKAALPRGARMRLRKALRRVNSRHARRPPMDPSLRARLLDEQRPEIERLATVLGRDLSHWLEPR